MGVCNCEPSTTCNLRLLVTLGAYVWVFVLQILINILERAKPFSKISWLIFLVNARKIFIGTIKSRVAHETLY